MSRWGRGWEVGARKAIHQHERAQRGASEILRSEHGVGHAPGSRDDLCHLCQELTALNARVTGAILRAEGLPQGSLEARLAFREVSSLEEAIASVTIGGDIEGDVARLGAISAAIRAGDYPRALQLGRRYAPEMPGVVAQANLRCLLEEAERSSEEG